MAYDVYLDKVLLPITPSKIKTKISNQNKTINLINEGEVNILKAAGLTEVSLEITLPNLQYHYARYTNGFQKAKYYLDILEEYKASKQPFQFIVSRTLPNGDVLFYSNLKVALEDYEIMDDASEAFDVKVSIKLKQHKAYGTKKMELASATKTVTKTTRDAGAGANTAGKQYTIKSGDTLWNIAKLMLGDGSKWTLIYAANKDVIEAAARAHGKASSNNGQWIYPGTVIVIPGADAKGMISNSGSSSGKTTGEYKGSGGSTNNPPFTVLDNRYAAVKANINSFEEAMKCYMQNNGAVKGWSIVDGNNYRISLTGSKTSSPFSIRNKNGGLIKAGLASFEAAMGYYSTNGGTKYGWVIVDSKGLKVSL